MWMEHRLNFYCNYCMKSIVGDTHFQQPSRCDLWFFVCRYDNLRENSKWKPLVKKSWFLKLRKPFLANILMLFPPENTIKSKIFWFLGGGGYKIGTLAGNRLIYWFNPFLFNFPFWSPLKTSENQRSFDVFCVVKKELWQEKVQEQIISYSHSLQT